MAKKQTSDTEMTIIPVTEEETQATQLALRFIDEALAAIVSCEIYSDAYRSLREHLFMPLQPFGATDPTDDFDQAHSLLRPGNLQLLVGPYTFYSWFKAWVRKQGIDPRSLTIPNGYPFTFFDDDNRLPALITMI
jgi:hypothetical protein